MKIDMITYSRTRNYGGILQTYGLYRYLEMTGHEVEIIDYIPGRCDIKNRKRYCMEAAKKSRLWGKNNITIWMFSVMRYPGIKKTFRPFLDFITPRVKFTKEYHDLGELYENIPEADVYISGSDQIWNSEFTCDEEPDLPFYLPFVNEGRRISYASSFGRNFVPEKHLEEIKDLLGKYDALSVREVAGKKILDNMSLLSTVTVDPTILCPLSEWERLAGERQEQRYILLYMIKFDRELYELATSAAKRVGKRLVIITLDKRDNMRIKADTVLAPEVTDWLGYIKYADGVITDSFHAMIFSILFKVRFLVCIGTRKGMSSRITDLLNLLDLKKRSYDKIDASQAADILTQSIDWKECHKKLSKQRENSVYWLEDALRGCACERSK